MVYPTEVHTRVVYPTEVHTRVVCLFLLYPGGMPLPAIPGWCTSLLVHTRVVYLTVGAYPGVYASLKAIPGCICLPQGYTRVVYPTVGVPPWVVYPTVGVPPWVVYLRL